MLTPTQIRHYRQNGFLVLERFFEDSQIQALRRELAQMINSAPINSTNRKNRYGQTVEHASDFSFTLQDPEGMGQVINRISNPLARSEVILRAYGHPKLLQAVASLCGSDFVPFAESVVIKVAHLVRPLTGTRTVVSRPGNNRSVVSISASIFTPQQWRTVVCR